MLDGITTLHIQIDEESSSLASYSVNPTIATRSSYV